MEKERLTGQHCPRRCERYCIDKHGSVAKRSQCNGEPTSYIRESTPVSDYLPQIAGSIAREIETKRTALIPHWLGEDIADIMAEGGRFFDDMGGYTLPKPRS